MRRLARRILLACLVALAAAYPVYYVAANAWIRPGGGLERLLNRRPDFLLIRWKSAHTPWPGIVSVEGFTLRSQVSTVQWWVALDKGRATIDLPALRRREFRLLALSGNGVDFRLARRLDARSQRRLVPAFQPAIPGLSNPPKPGQARRRAGARRQRQPWRIALSAVALDRVREVWIEEYRFTGDARLEGGFDLLVRRRLTVAPSTALVRRGALRRGAGAILAGTRGTIAARILALDPRRVKGRQVLGFTVGRAQLAGQVGDLGVLRELVQGAHWVDLRGGGGPITADLRLDRGRFAAGSRLEARPRGVGIGFLDYAATGTGTVLWTVEPGPARPEPAEPAETTETTGRLLVAFDRYEVRRGGAARPHVKGQGLRLSAASAAPRADRLFAPISIALEMPHAVVQDLAFYNSYLPARSGLRLRGGTGSLTGKFQAAAPGWVGSGEVLLVGRRIAAEMDGRRLTGDLRLEARLGHADVRERVFDLAGSRLEVTGVTLAGPAVAKAAAPGWWARFHVDHGRLMPGRPVFLTARVEAMMRDPKPLVALFTPEQKGWLARRVVRLLDVQGVGATADVRLGEDLVQVDRLAVAGGPAELRGRLRFAAGGRAGVLFARYGRLSLGMELADGERQLHLIQPRKWFEARMVAAAPAAPSAPSAPSGRLPGNVSRE